MADKEMTKALKKAQKDVEELEPTGVVTDKTKKMAEDAGKELSTKIKVDTDMRDIEESGDTDAEKIRRIGDILNKADVDKTDEDIRSIDDIKKAHKKKFDESQKK
jgi:hypothetical protein